MAQLKEAWGENCGTEEAKKDGATDELEAKLLSGRSKTLPNSVQRFPQITARKRGREGGREGGRGVTPRQRVDQAGVPGKLVVRGEDIEPCPPDQSDEGALVMEQTGTLLHLSRVHFTVF